MYKEIIEVNLFAFAYGLFHEDFFLDRAKLVKYNAVRFTLLIWHWQM